MSFLKKLHSQLTSVLSNSTGSFEDVDKIFKTSSFTEQINGIFPNIDEVQDKQASIVYVSLTVQDILEPQYFYAYLIKKPVSSTSDVKILKYGFQEKQLEHINLDDYEAIMQCRETVVCVDDFYRTAWVQKQWKGPMQITKKINLKMPQNHNLKLGERLNAVCVWNPINKYLVFLRNATVQQTQKERLCFSSKYIHEQIKMKEMKQLVCSYLGQFCTKPQSLLVLYSLISDEPMFTNGENIIEQIQELLPRVCHLKIKAPFKQSFFPYKNQEGVLVQTKLQLSSMKTFVIIDFSEFSQQKQVKIDQKEIDNLKALKLFVQQGKTIYRWEYGESLMDHIHSGIIVKGSKIINPHFHLSENLIDSERKNKNPFKQLDVEVKMKIRGYLDKCFEVKPTLNNQERMKIQQQIKHEIEKYPNERVMIQQRMQLARLNAKCLGKISIEYQDYIFAKDLLRDGH